VAAAGVATWSQSRSGVRDQSAVEIGSENFRTHFREDHACRRGYSGRWAYASARRWPTFIMVDMVAEAASGSEDRQGGDGSREPPPGVPRSGLWL